SAFLNISEEQTIKTMLFMADGEQVVALLVGNDQVNDVNLKNHLGADFFDVEVPSDDEKIFVSGYASLRPVVYQENIKIIEH
ncbi:YbaK/EbsC family protein, partial [Streptococcus suis]